MFAFCNRRRTSIKILQWDDRRRFDAALTVLKKDFTKEQLKETVAYQAMTRIGILYKVEELIKDKTPEERYQERQKQSRPIVDALFEWLHSMEDSVDRSSLIGDAILYMLNQETYLRRYLDDLNRLLPWSDELSEEFRTKQKK